MGHFADRLKALRHQSGFTQAKLAEAAGMKLAGITDLEQGRREPSWATVQKICAALGVGCEVFNEPVKPVKKRK